MNIFKPFIDPALQVAKVAFCIALFGGGFYLGQVRVQAKWDAEKIDIANQAETLRLAAQTRINTIDSKGAAKAKKQAATDQTTLSKVDDYAPSTLPLLPGSVRVLHDAAATGQKIDDSGTADADPVAVRDLAGVTVKNYISARSDKAALEELQAIVRASGCFDVEP